MNQGQFIKSMEHIGDQLREIFANIDRPGIMYGNVDSVDEEAKTINVRIGDAGLVIPDISLTSITGGDSNVILYPAVDSAVIIGVPYKQYENSFVVTYTIVDKVEINISDYSCKIDNESIYLSSAGGASAELKDDTVTLNGGEIGGMVIPSKLTDRMNKLESQIDQIQTNILAHTHATPVGPTTGITYTKVSLTSFKDDDYENTKVMQ